MSSLNQLPSSAAISLGPQWNGNLTSGLLGQAIRSLACFVVFEFVVQNWSIGFGLEFCATLRQLHIWSSVGEPQSMTPNTFRTSLGHPNLIKLEPQAIPGDTRIVRVGALHRLVPTQHRPASPVLATWLHGCGYATLADIMLLHVYFPVYYR